VSNSQRYLRRETRAVGRALKLRFDPIIVEEAKGSRVWDPDGKSYLDFASQWGVTNIGHNHPAVVSAVKNQAEKLLFSAHNTFPNVPTIEFAEKLIRVTPGRFSKKVWFGLSGSDAAEFIYKVLPVATQRRRLLSFYGSYHGASMGGITISGHKFLSRYIGMGNSVKIPYPYPYRCTFCRDSQCNLACFDYAKEQILSNYDTGDIAAAVVEPIQSDAGEIVPPDDFMPKVKQLCKDTGMLFVDDEVKVGFGRTGKMFACEHSGVEPDVMMLGKPIASGLPLSAVVGRKEVMDAALSSHIYTQSGQPLCCAAGIATLGVIERQKIPEKASKMGKRLMDRLDETASKHDLIGEVRGKGLIVGVELVKNKESKEPASLETLSVVYRAYQIGLILGAMGTWGNVLELMPPLNVSEHDLERGADILEKSIDDVEKGKVDKAQVRRFSET
jgi:4-aminobutyrate aminotransferase